MNFLETDLRLTSERSVRETPQRMTGRIVINQMPRFLLPNDMCLLGHLLGELMASNPWR